VADAKISALTELAGADVVADDWIPIVDVSTTTTKKLNPLEIKDVPSLGLQLTTITDAGSLITATTVNDAFQEAFSGKCAVNTVAATGAAETLTDAPIQKMTMDQNCEFTFPTPSTAGHIFMLHLIGAFTPTFPAAVDWPDAAAPTYTTPSIYVFVTDDTGTTWFGSQVGKAFG
jgi:hypothetical protein